jgi:hypothetical protein
MLLIDLTKIDKVSAQNTLSKNQEFTQIDPFRGMTVVKLQT